MTSIYVTKTILSKDVHSYSILVKDIYDNIKELESTFTEELKHLYMGGYFSIITAKNRKIGEDIAFKITDVSKYDFNALSDLVQVERIWIALCWRSFVREYELSFNKQLISISKPTVKSDSEIIETMINDSHCLLNDKKYTECVELLKEGLKYKGHRCFKILAYNMACAYALLRDEENTFLYLNMAIECGYNDWRTAQNDYDFKELYENRTFLSLIIKMRQI